MRVSSSNTNSDWERARTILLSEIDQCCTTYKKEKCMAIKTKDRSWVGGMLSTIMLLIGAIALENPQSRMNNVSGAIIAALITGLSMATMKAISYSEQSELVRRLEEIAENFPRTFQKFPG